jgi:hypothetical protein
MKITMTDKIIKLLKKAALIKDKIEFRCNKDLRYDRSKKDHFMCLKCYPNQPERSKREDLNCENCKIPRIFNCCWGENRHKNDESCDYYKFKMRCSEHCRNAVRDK